MYISTPTMYFIVQVTLFFANGSLAECRIYMEFYHTFFLTLKLFLVHIPCLLMLKQRSLLM